MGDAATPPDEAVTPLVLKIVLCAVMIGLTIVFGLLPIKVLKILRKKAAGAQFEDLRWPSLTLCLLSCFTGGVFLSTCFLHLLPEVSEKLRELKDEEAWSVDYPIGELISCAGFFLVWLIEEIVVAMFHGHGHTHGPPLAGGGSSPTLIANAQYHRDNTNHKHQHSDVQILDPSKSTKLVSKSTQSTKIQSGFIDDQEIRRFSPPSKDGASKPEIVGRKAEKDWRDDTRESATQSSEILANDLSCLKSHEGVELAGANERESDLEEKGGNSPKKALLGEKNGQNGLTGRSGSSFSRGRPPSPFSETYNCQDLAEPERCEIHTCDGQDEDPPILMVSRPHAHSHPVRSITLLVALSFHSVIEGLAFGVQSTNSAIGALFMSLIVHKCVVAFSMGLQLARTHAHQLQWVVVSIVILALMSPVGVGVGIGIAEANINQLAKDIVICVFEGLAVGTFLYVTFFEVFIHERDNEHNSFLKLVVTILGFGLIGVLRIFGHEHSTRGHSHATEGHVTISTPMTSSNGTLIG